MRTVRRVVLIGLAGVVVLGLIGWFGLKAYLRSSGAREMVAGRLTEALGLPVEVSGLSVGASESSLQFRVLEPATEGTPPEPVLTVESATADVSLGDLVRQSASPKEVTLSGVTLLIRIDKDGRVLTKLPSPSGDTGGDIPAVKIENGTLRLRQDGRQEFVMSNIRGRLESKGKTLAVEGGATDPGWGEWTLTGSVDPKAATANIVIATAAGPIDMERLRSIPYVPPDTWNHVKATGTTAAKVTFDVHDKKLDYRVELTPTGKADVEVPDIDATIRGVSGGVRIEAAKVHLIDLKGKLADGDVTVGGDLDFQPEPAVLKFRITAAGVDVRKLPAEWTLPKQLTGRLKGQADLQIRVPKSGPNQYAGGGAATIDSATVAGLPAEVSLRLRSDGKRYRFDGGGGEAKPVSNGRSSGVIVRPPVRTVRQEQPKPKPADEPTTLDATVTLRDVDVAELLTKLEVKVPYRLAGKVTVKASVSIPVAQADNTQTYRFAGTVSSPDFGLEGLRLRDVSADIKYADGKLALTGLRGKLGDGTFTGTATAAVRPAGELAAMLNLDRVSLAEALKAVPNTTINVRGPVSGTVTFRGLYEKLADPATWSGSADLRSDELTVYDRVVKAVRLPLTLAAGKLSVKDGRATVETIPLAAGGSFALSKPYAFTSTAKTTGVEAADFRKLVPELALPFPLAGKLDTTAKLTGTASPLTYTASGTATSEELTVGTRGANKVSVDWAVDADRVRIPKLAASLFGGTVSGSADIPLSAAKAGRFDVSFKDVDAAVVAKTVPDVPVRLTGAVSGELKGTLPAAAPGQPRTQTADLDLTAPKLTVQGIPAERLTGKIGFAGGGIEYKLEGRTLGGTFELNGRYPSKTKPADRGSVRLRGLNLREAARAFGSAGLTPLRGSADLEFEVDNDLTDGTGRLVVRDLRWGATSLASQLSAALRLRDGYVELADVTGTLAGGVIRGRGRLGQGSRSYFNVSVDRADAKRLFAPVPSLAESVTGEVSVVFRGRPGNMASGSGSVVLNRGTLFDLPTSELRLPFDWSVGPGMSEVVVRDAAGRVGDGRVTGKATFTSGTTDRLDGQIQFSDVRLGSALSALKGNRFLGQGRVTGRFDFAAAPFRTSDDLTGRLTATLNQTSVQEIPILRQVSPYLTPTGVTAPFQSGEVRGKLSRNVFRLDALNLANPSAQLHAEGTITLTGRLDLDVVANTGRLGVDDRAARLLGLRLPVAGPIPLTLLRDVSDFLSNRTIRLSVTGTTDAPQVRVNAAALLSDEAVRFLLSRYVPALGVGSPLYDPNRN